MGKIKELDGLRGLLAVWVVIVHLLPSVGIASESFGPFGPLFGSLIRVKIFCILSGFVIFLMLDRRRQGYGEFIRGRLLRIYPAFLVAFLLSLMIAPLAVEALRQAPFEGARLSDRLLAFESGLDRLPAHVVAHLTLLHGLIPRQILPNAAYTFLGQAWNISTEFQFYLLVPLLFAGLATGATWRRWAVGLACLLAWVFLRHWPNPANLAAYAPYFGLGIASFVCWRRDWAGQGWLTPLSVAGVAIAACLLADMAIGIWGLVLGWLLLVRDRGASRRPIAWLSSRPMLWLGHLSYSLYLLHMTPLYLGMYLLNGQSLDRWSYLGLLAVFTFALSIPMAWMCTRWVEQPFYRKVLRRPVYVAGHLQKTTG